MAETARVESPDIGESSGFEQAVGALIQHSETWGKVWFGLVFWGSVLFALGQRVWPDASTWPMLAVSLAIGLAAGVGAHLRGYWL